MKVLITGGCGFLGTNLTIWFRENEPQTEVLLFDVSTPKIKLGEKEKYIYGDIRNLNSLIQAMQGVDEVYHLAGILGTSELLDMVSLATDINISGVANVLDAARITGVNNIYNVAKPHFEGYAENAYTLTKHAGELLGTMYRDKYDMNVATVRWLNAVGPYQHIYPVRKFVPMMILQAIFDRDLEVYGSGNQTIDPIDVRDLARFTVYACRNLGKHPDVVDLGSGVAITCNDAVEMILKIMRGYGFVNSKITHIPMRVGEGDDINLKADMKFWDALGMTCEVSFEDSIRSVVDYMLSLDKVELHNALMYYGK
jgi:UDP-glucose 4-epimerase